MIYTKKDVKEAADLVYNKICKYNKRTNSYNRIPLLQASCSYYCNLMQYAEPDNKKFWLEVQDYIKYRF